MSFAAAVKDVKLRLETNFFYLNFTCKTSFSSPTPTIQWHIDGHSVLVTQTTVLKQQGQVQVTSVLLYPFVNTLNFTVFCQAFNIPSFGSIKSNRLSLRTTGRYYTILKSV